MSKVSLLFALIVMAQFSIAQDFDQFDKLTYQSAQNTLHYRLLKPKGVKENQKYPLVIFLHGIGERGNDNISNLKYITPLFLNEKNRNNFPCYVAVPQCPATENWTYPNWYQEPKEPMRSVIALIDSLSALPFIDSRRIYIMGLSMGGYGTWYLVTRFPDKFAAAIPICGGGDWSQAEKIAHVPIWAFHGGRDETIDPDQTRTMIKAIKKAGGKPLYTEYKKVGHDSWINAFKEPEFLPWLFKHKLP
jgi:predicted peptidase